MKSLLLGTAAAFVVAGGAQAADLTIAVEPVDYVKVCDAFGTGYYYIPHSDTCLKIAGKAQLDVKFYDSAQNNLITGAGGFPVSNINDRTYTSSWSFSSEAAVNFTAKSMSDLGPIVVHFAFTTLSDNNDWKGNYAGEKVVRWDGGYGAIGPLMFGWTASTFDPGGGYTYDQVKRSDTKTDQIRFSYNMGQFGIMVGLEDPRDRWAGFATGDMPDIILALTGGGGPLSWKVAAGVADLTIGTAWAVDGTFTVDLGGGTKIKVNGAFGDNAWSFVSNGGAAGGTGTSWSTYVSAIMALSGNTDLVGTVSYLDDTAGNPDILWAALGVQFHPTSNSEIGVEVNYTDPSNASGTWGVHGRLKTTFNGG